MSYRIEPFKLLRVAEHLFGEFFSVKTAVRRDYFIAELRRKPRDELSVAHKVGINSVAGKNGIAELGNKSADSRLSAAYAARQGNPDITLLHTNFCRSARLP